MSNNNNAVNQLANGGNPGDNPIAAKPKRKRNRKPKAKAGVVGSKNSQQTNSGGQRGSGQMARKPNKLAMSHLSDSGEAGYEFAMQPARAFTTARLEALTKQHYPPELISCVKRMMLPSDDYGRFPGNVHAPTATYRSVREFTIYANFSDAPGMSGRFSGAISFTLGDNGIDPVNYQISLVNTQAGFPQDLTLPGSFITGAAGPVSSDLRFDRSFASLTQPALGSQTGVFYQAYFASVTTPLANPNGGPIVGNSGLYPTITNAGASSQIALPVGQYIMNLIWTAPVGTPVGIPLVITPLNGAVVDVIQSYLFVDSAGDGGTYQKLAISIYAPNQSIDIGSAYPGGATGFGEVDIAPGFFPNRTPPIPQNGGMIRKVRTTGGSILLTNTMANQYTGGEITINLVDSETLKNSYFINGSQSSLAMYENLAAISGRPPYRGEVKRGAYGFYVPLDINQTKFTSPDDVKFQGLPQIVFSGVYSNAANLTGYQEVMRGQMILVIEYSTDSLVPEVEYPDGSLDELDKLVSVFDKGPVCCENPTHKSKIGGFLSKLPRIASDVSNTIKTGKELLGTFGL